MAAAKEPTLQSSFDLSKYIAKEPNKEVPNHLLDTKIFAKLGHNDVLHAKPSAIHFAGFEIGKISTRILQIINVSSERQRMHIIPPTTHNFGIKYTKEDTLVPGLYLEVLVEFKANSYQYYHDCIRIHSKGSENILVPLYAYPVMDIKNFPANVHFSPTAIGQTKTKVIPLKCSAEVDFEFQITFIQRHSAFTVEPISGFVPGGDKIDIKVTFSPKDYSTAHMQLQVNISQFNSKPLSCSFTGTSLPGLVKKLKDAQQIENVNNKIVQKVVDPRALSPLNRSRNRKSERKKNGIVQEVAQLQKETQKDGIRFPTELNNHAAVSYVLTQKAGKMKAKDLREAVKIQSQVTPSTKQMKEAVFEHIVDRNIKDEQRNQLRWCVKLGDEAATDASKQKVLLDRQKALNSYMVERGDPQIPEELQRSATLVSNQRIHRQADYFSSAEPSFDFYANDVWSKRHRVLRKFILAARKVIVRQRTEKHKSCLGTYVADWRKGKFSVDHSRNWNELDEEQRIINTMSTSINPQIIKPFALTDYLDPNSKDDMAVDSLGAVKVPATNVEVKTRVPYFNLRVPSQSLVLGYTPHTIPLTSYVPKGLPRPLRSPQVIEVRQDDVNTIQRTDVFVSDDKISGSKGHLSSDSDKGRTSKSSENLSAKLKQESMKSLTEDRQLGHDDDDDIRNISEGGHLVMPIALLNEKDYPPLHIFSPEVGVTAYATCLLHSETDEEHRLLPTPTGTNNQSQIRLDRQDVIGGSMTWRRFPCQGLVTLNSTPSMSAVYVPRSSDPFSTDLMPVSTPSLLTELPKEDAVIEDETDPESNLQYENTIVPTMEMVHAQFKIPEETDGTEIDISDSFAFTGRLPATNNPIGKHGLVSKSGKERELNKYIQEKLNRLGSRIRTNADSFETYMKLNAKEKDR